MSSIKKNKRIELIDINLDISAINDNFALFEKLNGSTSPRKNQLFSINCPPFDLVEEIINLLTNGQNNYFEFSKKIIINKDIINKIQPFILELKKYYIPCKHKKYLENLNEKKIITLFRQILKPYNYTLISREKYENGAKFLLYIIMKKKGELKKINSLIHFD